MAAGRNLGNEWSRSSLDIFLNHHLYLAGESSRRQRRRKTAAARSCAGNAAPPTDFLSGVNLFSEVWSITDSISWWEILNVKNVQNDHSVTRLTTYIWYMNYVFSRAVGMLKFLVGTWFIRFENLKISYNSKELGCILLAKSKSYKP